ncbi:hypothetical protein ANN_27528 [Periplaneta americana]|uniref:Uncharacterized protein n=1 Tax=Periplaneta americana TaxID=6978 RepID=A0ABQ8RW70_PERAM|nr:hypothetical protein ANN_27528 [Periplaneta americana]
MRDREMIAEILILQMATFSLQKQRVIIRFLHLTGVTAIEIHCARHDTARSYILQCSRNFLVIKTDLYRSVRNIDVVKNEYVCREIALRSDKCQIFRENSLSEKIGVFRS